MPSPKHAQTDGQLENIMPLVAHRIGSRLSTGIKMILCQWIFKINNCFHNIFDVISESCRKCRGTALLKSVDNQKVYCTMCSKFKLNMRFRGSIGALSHFSFVSCWTLNKRMKNHIWQGVQQVNGLENHSNDHQQKHSLICHTTLVTDGQPHRHGIQSNGTV